MVRAVAVLPEGHRVASAGTDGTIRVWEIETGQNLAVVGGRLGHVQALVALPDGRSLVSGDYDRVRDQIESESVWMQRLPHASVQLISERPIPHQTKPNHPEREVVGPLGLHLPRGQAGQRAPPRRDPGHGRLSRHHQGTDGHTE